MATSSFARSRLRLAQAVKRRRVALGLTQEDAAHAIRIATRHYQKLESGEVNVTLRTLVRVAEAFEIEVRDLLS